jgi:hypothetical protein
MPAARPFPFVFEELAEVITEVKPMFGAWGLYRDDRIVLILRDKPTATEDNGAWIPTLHEHHVSLRREFPTLRSLHMFGPGETEWQNLPSNDDDFENLVLRLCRMIRDRDPRIGKIPASRRVRKTKPKLPPKTSTTNQKKSKVRPKAKTKNSTSAKPDKSTSAKRRRR